jgi:sugar lactone lactonase YvrE
MALFTELSRNLRQIIFRNAEQHAIPSMDGALSPNDRLDDCRPIGEPIPEVDDIAEGSDGALYVSAGNRVLRLAGEGYGERRLFATLDGKAGGLAFHPDGRLLICVSGRGLLARDAAGNERWLNTVEDHPLLCPTSVVAAKDGTIFLSNGSERHAPEDWCHDLMEKNHTGRLIACGPGLDGARVLRSDLHYPHGLALSSDGRSLWLSESWNHRISRTAIAGAGIGAWETMIRNLPGYPARLATAATGGFWLSLFALRTHLVEFVLREDDYRLEMMRTIPSAFWISPALAATNHCLEPMQAGGVKALGIHKPWAPPRAYGLVVRLDADGDALESLHSRVGGHFHGVTAARETAQGLVVVAKGSARLLLAPGDAG